MTLKSKFACSQWLDAPVERWMSLMNQCPAERLLMTPEPLPPKEPKAKAERAKPKQSPEPPQTSLF